jgi:branched-chain amino acid transport system permease protein
VRRKHWLGLVIIAAVAIVFELFFESLVTDSSKRQLVMLAATNILVALSLNVINGMAGQFSIGHAGFLALGAYAAAITAAHLHQMFGPGADVTFTHSLIVMPLSMLAAAGVAGLFGLVVGLPSLRLRGDYLAIVTLGFAEIVRLTIATAQVGADPHSFAGYVSRLGGQNGYAGPDNAGIPLYGRPFWIVVVTAVGVMVAWRVKFSGWGRALRALREDEIAAAAVGVDPTSYKVTSFVISAMGAGVAGSLLALMSDGAPIVQPDSFTFQTSFDAITMVILGGSGSVSGAALGGVFVTITVKMIELVQGTRAVQDLHTTLPWLDLNALRMILYSGVLIALMIWRPEGMLGERELRLPRFFRRQK